MKAIALLSVLAGIVAVALTGCQSGPPASANWTPAQYQAWQNLSQQIQRQAQQNDVLQWQMQQWNKPKPQTYYIQPHYSGGWMVSPE